LFVGEWTDCLGSWQSSGGHLDREYFIYFCVLKLPYTQKVCDQSGIFCLLENGHAALVVGKAVVGI